MVFANLFFLYIFLPVNLILYYATRSYAVRNFVLVAMSFLFYAWGEPVWVLLLLFLSLKKLNDYGFLKTVLVAIIALAFMVIILAVAILLISLTAQLITFFTGLWEEIDLKYIH